MQFPSQPSVFSLTPTMLRLMLTCERRVWLDYFGDPAQADAITPVMAHRYSLGETHEQHVQEAAGTVLEPIAISSWDEGVALTRALMAQGVAVITGAYLEREVTTDAGTHLVVRGRADRLERVDSGFRLGWGSRQRAPVYAPIEIKRYQTLEDADLRQLDAYLWMLEGIQPDSVSGWFWLGQGGDDRPLYTTEHVLDAPAFEQVLHRLAATLQRQNPPEVRLEPYCKQCPWYSSCRAEVSRRLHVSILPGLSRQAKQNLEQQGITTLDQIVALPPESLTRFKGIKTTAHAVHAQARAFVENQPIWFQALPDVCHQPGVMFDLETDPFTQQPWSWGWVDRDLQAHVLIVANRSRERDVRLDDGRVIHTVTDVDAAWSAFADAVADGDEPIYHWTGFDAGVMRATAPDGVRQRLEGRMHDLHRSFKSCVKFPVDGNSLKVVARYLNFQWAEYDAWDAAYWDYRRWLQSGDLIALSRSANYQQADVEAMVVVWQWLIRNLPR